MGNRVCYRQKVVISRNIESKDLSLKCKATKNPWRSLGNHVCFQQKSADFWAEFGLKVHVPQKIVGSCEELSGFPANISGCQLGFEFKVQVYQESVVVSGQPRVFPTKISRLLGRSSV